MRFLIVLLFFCIHPNSFSQDKVKESYIKALKSGDLTQLENIRKSGFDLTTPLDKRGTSAMHIAACKGHDVVIAWLYKNGVPIDMHDEQGNTPLHALCSAQLEGELAKTALRLLSLGAYPNARNIHGWTPLHTASAYGHEELLSPLISSGAAINMKNFYGATPLAVAAEWGHMQVVQFLLVYGAAINETDSRGRTPLERALRNNQITTMILLLEWGADINLFATNNVIPILTDVVDHLWVREALCGFENAIYDNLSITPYASTYSEDIPFVLILSAARGFERCVWKILSQYYHLLTDDSFLQAVLKAAVRGHAKTLEALLKWSIDFCDFNVKKGMLCNELILAMVNTVTRNDIPCAMILFSYLNQIINERIWSELLIISSLHSDATLFEYIINRLPDASTSNEIKKVLDYALTQAAQAGNRDGVQRLLVNGAPTGMAKNQLKYALANRSLPSDVKADYIDILEIINAYDGSHAVFNPGYLEQPSLMNYMPTELKVAILAYILGTASHRAPKNEEKHPQQKCFLIK